jgi:hypothetical protein
MKKLAHSLMDVENSKEVWDKLARRGFRTGK